VSRHPLETLLRPTWLCGIDDPDFATKPETAQVVCDAGAARAEWLRADQVNLFVRPASVHGAGGEALARFHDAQGNAFDATFDDKTCVVRIPFSLGEAYRAYISESWRTVSSNRRLSERSLKAFYLVKPLIPRQVQLLARRRMIQRQGVPEFPRWPLDLSVRRLLEFYAGCELRAAAREAGEFLWFWPKSHRAAVILTHDVENNDGIRLALELADVEQEHGFRSSFNFGAWYTAPDPGVIRELNARGFEIGMHGLTHDRQLFSSRQAFEERLPALAELARELGAVGFRSPATHRVFDWLSELPVDYDCTISNSDPYEPQPGGCCSIWPFFIGDVVELPYTLPQDHTLLTLLGHRSPKLWLDQAHAIEENFGLIQCVSHPDPGYLGDPDKRAIYAEFLSGLAERDRIWRALPREVASWWRLRAGAEPGSLEIRRGCARLSEGAASAVLEPPV
jgi:peptidoglycan/xylan/chitin deacetylase (PgdA/CDA1 family)